MNTEKKHKFRLIRVLMALLLWLGPALPAGAAEFNYHSLTEALRLAKDQDKMVMIFFWADWCGYCIQIRREVFSDPAVREVFDRNFLAVSVDVENDPEKLARKFRIRPLPTLIFLKSDGEPAGFWPGAADRETFFKLLEYLLKNNKGKEAPDV
ncbi:MAG: thioredoxin fold domain-containing protein [Deltaproteobacteria bacterium]|nr:thioredoxin fold domain-containing protein [Deltaproteobacteria bacterium]